MSVCVLLSPQGSGDQSASSHGGGATGGGIPHGYATPGGHHVKAVTPSSRQAVAGTPMRLGSGQHQMTPGASESGGEGLC